MAKRFKIVHLMLLCALLLVFSFTVSAQAADWEVVLFSQAEAGQAPANIVFVRGSGGQTSTETLAVPASMFEDGRTLYNLRISPDRRYIAAETYQTNADGLTTQLELRIADLTTGAAVTASLPSDVDGMGVGPFSPESTHVAVVYIQGMYDPTAPNITGTLALIDTPTGQVSLTSPMADVVSAIPAPDIRQYGVYALFGSWKPEGVQFVPSCYACEGTFQFPYWLWDPTTDAVTPDTEFFSFLGDTLEITGELLVHSYNQEYPSSPVTGMLGPSNLVRYYADGQPPFSYDYTQPRPQDTNPIVYFDTQTLNLGPMGWVADGAAFYVANSDINYQTDHHLVVFRSGQRVEAPIGLSERFLIGTPDGLLTQENGVLKSYAIDAASETVSEGQTLGTFGANLQVIDHTPMGATAPAQPPQAVNIDQAALTCPGAPPSRLVPGGQGRVTPGAPNNLRMWTDTTAEIMGEIPSGATFDVLHGPVCDPSGIPWWWVRYNDLEGVTAEGQGDEYFVEPVN